MPFGQILAANFASSSIFLFLVWLVLRLELVFREMLKEGLPGYGPYTQHPQSSHLATHP